jgi:hypothetical protein
MLTAFVSHLKAIVMHLAMIFAKGLRFFLHLRGIKFLIIFKIHALQTCGCIDKTSVKSLPLRGKDLCI